MSNYYTSRSAHGGKQHLFHKREHEFATTLCSCPGSNNGRLRAGALVVISERVTPSNMCKRGAAILAWALTVA